MEAFVDIQLRWVKPEHYPELIGLYHLARTALSGEKDQSKYARMLWASRQFAMQHAYLTATAAYKDLSTNLGY